ncbi:N-acetyllactosaminide 3-alpha-galactosyltransferase [Ancylostoma ceylanicum]|uniref:Hexosyltransferase n=1 Tax=Ancylostoma ceylanicum TaxID=53326 RepID=A0A0D6M1E2_9BILA|nr:N-acetyllactosaminide 3-alpha-galactosyltransferase [Ancylostoma ceylanicum]
MKSRNYWRQTYASPENQAKFGYSVIFPVGNSADAGVQRRLQVEADSYGDILQAHFVDSYRNLSLKMLSSFRYLSLTFPKEMAVLKVDSDVAWRIHDVIHMDMSQGSTSQNLQAAGNGEEDPMSRMMTYNDTQRIPVHEKRLRILEVWQAYRYEVDKL